MQLPTPFYKEMGYEDRGWTPSTSKMGDEDGLCKRVFREKLQNLKDD